MNDQTLNRLCDELDALVRLHIKRDGQCRCNISEVALRIRREFERLEVLPDGSADRLYELLVQRGFGQHEAFVISHGPRRDAVTVNECTEPTTRGAVRSSRTL